MGQEKKIILSKSCQLGIFKVKHLNYIYLTKELNLCLMDINILIKSNYYQK